MNKNMRKMYTEEQVAKIGSKLYLHTISDENYSFTFISVNPKPLDFTSLSTFLQLHLLLEKDYMPINFKEYNEDNIMLFDDSDQYYVVLRVYSGSVNVGDRSDWNLALTTDTVTPL